MGQAAIGIDLGGTYIKAVLTDGEGNILGWEKLPTEREKGIGHVLKRIQAVVNTLSPEEEELAGVGIGIPGMLDAAREKVFLAPNLGWKDVHLREELQQFLGVPVFLDNDANAAALGEAWLGAARDSSSFMLVTIGTGIGSGLVLGGEIYRGDNGLAAELGHMAMVPQGPKCSCGQRGCLETLVNAGEILRKAREASLVPEGAETRDVLELANSGNEEAARVVAKVMDYLAAGLKNTIVLLDLELILIGGGVGDSSPVFIHRLEERTIDLLPVKRNVKIIQAALGNRAGALGAARLALLELGSPE